jgi:hypothetical protein
MVLKGILRGWDDDSQPTVRNLAEVLETLSQHGCDLEAGRLWFEAPPTNSSSALVARLLFSSTSENIDVRFDLPLLQGAKARTTLGAPCSLPREILDQAEVDCLGNVRLTDGRWVHAVQFEAVDFPGPWTDLDEAIIWLTIRAFEAEHLFVRRHFPYRRSKGEPFRYGWVFIDYSILHILREPNVKELTRYINEHIQALPRESGKPPFKPVTIPKVQRTLNIAGVRKARGNRQLRVA